MDLGMRISNRIRELRKSKGLTQEKLSEKVGMDLTAFSRIERGKNPNIQLNTLDKIIQALEIDYSSFFNFSDGSDPSSRIISKLALVSSNDELIEIIEKIIDLNMKDRIS